MKEIKRGQIWLVNLDPTVGHEINKSRPAVIIQNDVGNMYSKITIVAPVTSQGLDNLRPIEVLLTPENSELIKNSKVLLNQIRAVDNMRLIKIIGHVKESTMYEIDIAIKLSLGLIKI